MPEGCIGTQTRDGGDQARAQHRIDEHVDMHDLVSSQTGEVGSAETSPESGLGFGFYQNHTSCLLV